MKNTFRIEPYPDFQAALKLLSNEKLPIEDVSHEKFKNFYGICKQQELIGLIGFEAFNKNALLRSLVIDKHYQKHGLGKHLVTYLEEQVYLQNIESIYLLTTTAEAFFSTLNYVVIDRASTPKSIQATTEFSSLCPATATVMVKHLKN